MDQLKACFDVIKSYVDTPGSHPGLTKDILSETPGVGMSTYTSVVTSDQTKAEKKTACEQYLAYLFIIVAYNVRYGSMMIGFHNEYLKDKD